MAAIILPLIIEGPATGNTGVGSSALLFNNGGISNTAFGLGTLKLNQNGDGNTAIGSNAMLYNTTGDDNTGVGRNALSGNSTGLSNTAIGSEALSSATGNLNTAIGKDAGILITTGQKNTVLGPFSGNQGGYDIRALSNYVVIADGDGNPRIIVDPAGLVSAPGGFSGGGGGGGTLTIDNKTAAYTVVSGDLGKIINCTAGTFTVSLTAAATLGSGFNCWVWNTGSGVITIDPNGAETIDGVTTVTLRRGEGTQIVCNGTNWETGDKKTMRGYAENIGSSDTRPTASGDRAIALGVFSSAAGTFSHALGYLTTASGTGSTGIGYFSTASGTYTLGINGDASGNYTNAIGHNSGGNRATTATGAGATAIGGSYASGTDSFAAGVGNNTSSYGATGANSIAIGFQSIANSSYAVSIGWANTAGNRSICIGGNTSSALDNSVCIGSWSSTISGAYSATLGGGRASDRSQQNRWAYGTLASPAAGNAQLGVFILYRQTADATPGPLTSNSSGTAAINNIPVLDNQCAYAFIGTVIAKQSGSTNAASWKIEGMIVRGAGAGTTTLVASTVTVISNVPGWNLALSADTTNGGLLVTATGAAATNIRWVANIQSSEAVYA